MEIARKNTTARCHTRILRTTPKSQMLSRPARRQWRRFLVYNARSLRKSNYKISYRFFKLRWEPDFKIILITRVPETHLLWTPYYVSRNLIKIPWILFNSSMIFFFVYEVLLFGRLLLVRRTCLVIDMYRQGAGEICFLNVELINRFWIVFILNRCFPPFNARALSRLRMCM